MKMADPYDIQGIIDYYTNLLIIQYNDQPKARATIALMVEQLEANGILFQVRDAFSVDDAVGVQLDIIGKYVGIDRYFNGQTLEGYFSLIPQGVNPSGWGGAGFTTQADFATETAQTLIYADIVSTEQALSDDAFRTLIKFQIINNNSNFSYGEIDNNLFDYFGDNIIASSSGNMEMVFFVTREFYQIALIAAQKGILPVPMGVGSNYLIQEDVQFFGLTTQVQAADGLFSPRVTGFTTQAAYAASTGKTLTYQNLTMV